MSILHCDNEIEVLLTQPDYGEETKKRAFQPGLEFPYNLTCLSSYLEREGVSNELFDWRVYDEPDKLLHELLGKLKPRVVGLTSWTCAIGNTAHVARVVKEFDSNILTVVGGPHASALPQQTLIDYEDIDYLVHGEGELVFSNFVKAARENPEEIQQLKGVAYRQDGEIRMNPREDPIEDMDGLPFPARHKIDIYRYSPNPGTRNYMRLPTTGLSAGRGCPYSCAFCYKGVWGRSVRFRSVENVVAEIKECSKKYEIHDFRFYDDVLTFPKWDIKGFCQQVIDQDLDISWSCWSRINDVNPENLQLMKQAGCYHLKYGIEFGTEKALKHAKKGITLEKTRRAINLTKEIGIECKGSFIFGAPGETEEDCRDTQNWALELSPDFATFYAFDLIPGSPYYLQMEQGLLKDEMLPREVTEGLVADAYRSFYARPGFVWGRIKAFWRSPGREIPALLNGVKMMFTYYLRRSKVGLNDLWFTRMEDA
jgi:radical SAM superfamily enzyme YgiQ (UPF0313 family)